MIRTFLVSLLTQAILLQNTISEGGILSNSVIPCDGRNIEKFLDEVLRNITAQMSDRLPLPDRNGFVKLTEGEVWGLPSLKRDGSATVVCNKNSLAITANLKVDEITGRYRWSRRVLLKEISGLILITAKIFEVKVKVSQENHSTAYLNLDTFAVTKMEGIDVEATGLTYFTWTLSKLIDPVVELFKRSTARIVAGPIRDAVAKELLFISIPLESRR